MFRTRVVFVGVVLLCFHACTAVEKEAPEEERQQQSQEEGGSSDSGGSQPQLLLGIDFVRDFRALFNPKNASSPFTWLKYSIDYSSQEQCEAANAVASDNGAFVFSNPEFMDMVSLPFARWLPPSLGVNATCAAHDAAVHIRKPIDLNKNQLLRVRMAMACETFNTVQHEFSDEAVKDPYDDPRMASCGMFIRDDEKSGLNFGFLLTSRGIWAVYGRSLRHKYLTQAKYHAFSAYRFVSTRNNSLDFADLRLIVNNAARETRYFLGSQPVWSVADWGVLSDDVRKSSRIVSESEGRDEPVTAIDSASLYIENNHMLDVKDPNVPEKDNKTTTNRALVRLSNAKDYYGKSMTFWHENSERERCLYGQGARTSMRRLQIDRI